MSMIKPIAALMTIAGLAGSAIAQEPPAAVVASDAELMASTRSLFQQDSANVFRRFETAITPQMVKFYTGALGLRPLQPIQLSASQQMILTGVGSGQIKLAAGQMGNRQIRLEGGHKGGTGLRFLTLSYPDEAALQKSFIDAGFAAPKFIGQGDGTRAALVTDPGSFPVQLVIRKGAKPGSNDGVGVGINTSDLERSRAFYREFIGLDELPPVKDKVLGITKYPYRHKETTIFLYKAGDKLPADTGSAGIQYVVSDAALADAKGKRRNIAIQTPLSKMRGFDLTTVWLGDPDGVTNYFAQVGPGSRTARARADTNPATPQP